MISDVQNNSINLNNTAYFNNQEPTEGEQQLEQSSNINNFHNKNVVVQGGSTNLMQNSNADIRNVSSVFTIISLYLCPFITVTLSVLP